LTWGLLTVLLGFTFSGSVFAAVRFLIGAAEAGAYPGIIYYLTLWFPKRYRVQALALMTIGSPLGNMFGSLFGGLLLNLDGTLGLGGWQWVFIATGVPAVLLFVLMVKLLPNGPQDAQFLNDRERSWLAGELARGEISQVLHTNPLRVLFDWRVWAFSLVYSMITLALYCVIYWLPTVVKGFGATSTQNGLLNSLPWAMVALMLLWVPRHLREHRSVLIGMSLIALCGAAAFLMSTVLPENWMRYVAFARHALHLADVSLLLVSAVPDLQGRPRRSRHGGDHDTRQPRRFPVAERDALGRALDRQCAGRHDRAGHQPGAAFNLAPSSCSRPGVRRRMWASTLGPRRIRSARSPHRRGR
jgi:MFS family permease